MCLVQNINLGNDEDFPANKKTKSRSHKPRDKWSLLWFIPSQVLNFREEVDDGKGRNIKKGKRLGFDRFNNLSCKIRRKAFHKYEAFGFHTSNAHDGQYNSSMSSRNIQSVPAKRINSEP